IDIRQRRHAARPSATKLYAGILINFAQRWISLSRAANSSVVAGQLDQEIEVVAFRSLGEGAAVKGLVAPSRHRRRLEVFQPARNFLRLDSVSVDVKETGVSVPIWVRQKGGPASLLPRSSPCAGSRPESKPPAPTQVRGSP